jgi:Rieske Fe-S protein
VTRSQADLDASREHTSLWPVGFAVGIVALLVGIVFSWIIAAVGAVLAVVCGVLWARSIPLGREPVVVTDGGPETHEPHGIPPADRYPRAVFLELSTLGLGGVIGGLITVPALGFMVLPPFLKQKFKDHDVGPVTDFPQDKWVIATFMADPTQGAVSRKTAFIRNNGFLGQQPSFTVISNHCAPLGGPGHPTAVPSKNTTDYHGVTRIPLEGPPSGFSCPCHGGQYDTEGNRTAGPPVRSLDRYSFSIRNGRLFLGAPFSVGHVEGTGASAKIYKWPLSFPGEPVRGLESWMYPIQPPH